MLSDDLPAVGSMVNDNNEAIDVDRQPWHFDDEALPSDEDTLVIASPLADIGSTYEPEVEEPLTGIVPVVQEDVVPPFDAPVRGIAPAPVSPRCEHRSGVATATTRTTERIAERPAFVAAPGASAGETRARHRRVVPKGATCASQSALGSSWASSPCFVFRPATWRRWPLRSSSLSSLPPRPSLLFGAQYHPATLLGLVATMSLMIETYNKGVAALPLVVVILVVANFCVVHGRSRTGRRSGGRRHFDGVRLYLDRCLWVLCRPAARPACFPIERASPSSWPQSS